jgi:hypothetical protein
MGGWSTPVGTPVGSGWHSGWHPGWKWLESGGYAGWKRLEGILIPHSAASANGTICGFRRRWPHLGDHRDTARHGPPQRHQSAGLARNDARTHRSRLAQQRPRRPHGWRGWLSSGRCVVPWTSFCEYAPTTPRKTPTWFARIAPVEGLLATSQNALRTFHLPPWIGFYEFISK